MLLLYNYKVYPSTFLEVSFGTKDWVSLTHAAEVLGGGASALIVKSIFGI